MRIHIDLIPDEIIEQYQLRDIADAQGYVYIEIGKGMYGLPQAGILANKQLTERLADYGYYPCRHTPGLWRYVEDPKVNFVLVVDDFSLKYTDREHAERFLAILRQWYPVKTDWNAQRFCGITIDWDYTQRTATLSMPGYVMSMLLELNHPPPKRPQHSPHPHNPIQYGANPQKPNEDDSPPLPSSEVPRIPQAVGKLLYYARAVDALLLPALIEHCRATK